MSLTTDHSTPNDAFPRWRVLAAIAATAALLAAYYGNSPNFRFSDRGKLFGGDKFQERFGGRLVNLGLLDDCYDPRQAEELQNNPEFIG